MKIIPIKIPNKLASVPCFIDDEDFSIVSSFKWNLNLDYAISKVSKNGIEKTIYLHRLIMNAPKGKVIDHINRNGLDNRKNNLRICSQGENLRNQRRSKIPFSGFKGVSFHKGVEGINLKKRWMVRINVGKKLIFGGLFATAEEAAKRYNELSLKYHGKFGLLNKIE